MHPLSSNLTSVPWTFWGWALLAVFAASALGFWAGARHQRGAAARAIQQARTSLNQLIQLASRRLEEAQEACRLFDDLPLSKMSDEQVTRLERQRGLLSDALSRLFERRAAAKEELRLRRSAPFEITWVREPVDAAGYPDRAAFDTNLAAMVATCTESETPCGLLLVKVDRIHQLRTRLDMAGIERLVQKLGGVVCRSVRDADLVCRIGFDSFGVLIPNVDGEEGLRIAQSVRNSVRHYHFRLEEHGDEILVTASFGYGPSLPAENPELVLNRAGDALARSQKRGRNQLHVHEGSRALVCISG
jgi:diguanylate cyclase (GGDEF)-like protein